jgi:hypothetical protein
MLQMQAVVDDNTESRIMEIDQSESEVNHGVARRSWRALGSNARESADYLNDHIRATFLPCTNTNIAPCAFRIISSRQSFISHIHPVSDRAITLEIDVSQWHWSEESMPVLHTEPQRKIHTSEMQRCLACPWSCRRQYLNTLDCRISQISEITALTDQQLSTNVDKKNFCLTSKETQILATPLLYKNMEISGKHLNRALLATLKAGHPGLPEARTLSISSRKPSIFGKPWSNEGELPVKVLCRLLHTMPQHCLTRFEYDTVYDLVCMNEAYQLIS